ncbi:helix-turn-helix domain-containing protein [Microbacterium sp. LWH13-1.2]|uniref:ArsR/SmtB family transcription factor n=1 Tax=Microbacterium sp. LWH13-1.2 TaxID=3135260 RepID=UPI003139FEEF
MADEEQLRRLDSGALKALAHPLRVRIFDLLSAHGPQTASSLASMLGETSGSTSYHLRTLSAHDLIHEVEGRGTARERWWELPEGRIDIPGPSQSMSPANRAAAQIVSSEFFRLRHETLMSYVNRPDTEVPEGWKDAGLIATTLLEMTPSQMEDLKDELTGVIEGAVGRYRGQTGPDVRRVSMRTELFDLPATGPVLADVAESNEEES